MWGRDPARSQENQKLHGFYISKGRKDISFIADQEVKPDLSPYNAGMTDGSYICDKQILIRGVVELLWHTPEANVTLCVNYTSI